MAKIDIDFDELTRRIARERIILGKDKKMQGIRRITLAMARHPDIKKIAKDIAEADFDYE